MNGVDFVLVDFAVLLFPEQSPGIPAVGGLTEEARGQIASPVGWRDFWDCLTENALSE